MELGFGVEFAPTFARRKQCATGYTVPMEKPTFAFHEEFPFLQGRRSYCASRPQVGH